MDNFLSSIEVSRKEREFEIAFLCSKKGVDSTGSSFLLSLFCVDRRKKKERTIREGTAAAD